MDPYSLRRGRAGHYRFTRRPCRSVLPDDGMEAARHRRTPKALGRFRRETDGGLSRCPHPSGTGLRYYRSRPRLHRGPKGVSPQIVETLHGAFKKAMEDPDFIKVSRQVDQPSLYRGPEELGKHLVKMNEEVGELIRSLGLREK